MKEKIKKFLKTDVIAKNIKYYKKIDSTQILARKMAEEKTQNGTMVISEIQEKGIGTHDRKWYSENEKNILFTIIIYPKCKLNNLKTLTVDIAKCMIDSVKNLYGIKLEIKDPNDIMCNGKKIGGILTQIVTREEQIKYLLVGIGFNVNQVEFEDEIKDIATSLKREFNKEFSREEIIGKFCNVFEKYLIENEII